MSIMSIVLIKLYTVHKQRFKKHIRIINSIILMCFLLPLFLRSSIKNFNNNLPADIIKIIALDLLKHDIKNAALDHSIRMFSAYYYFLEKGRFLGNYSHSQAFNNLFFINKSFYHAISHIKYEDKLDIWFQERIILPDFFYEVSLLLNLAQTKNFFYKANQKTFVSCALKFFSHSNFFEVLFEQEEYRINHNTSTLLRPKGVYHTSFLDPSYKKKVLTDCPYIFVIFCHYLISYYKTIEGNRYDLRKKVSNFVKISTPFGCNSGFDIHDLESFCYYSLQLSHYRLLKQDSNLIKDIESLVCTEKKYSLKELFLDFIDYYLKLDVKRDLRLYFKWYNKAVLKELNDDQKILWFYYTHAIYLATLSDYRWSSCLFAQDLLFEIEEWLHDTYPDTALIISDELVSKFKDCTSNRIFRLLDYVVKDAKKNNIFNPNLLFDSLRVIFNSDKDLILKKRDKNITKKAFYSSMTKEFFNHINNVVRIQAFIRRYNALSLKFNYQASAQSFKDVIFEKKIKILNFLNKVTSLKKYFFMGIFLSISGILFYWSRLTYFRFII